MPLPTLALIGYGKMGREIERAALSRGFSVRAIIDVNNAGHSNPIDASTLNGAEVCIEFTTPDAALDNIRACASLGKHIVVGTTGWFDRLDEARAIVSDAGTGLIYASNFSIGVHLFMRLVSFAGKLLNAYEGYDAGVHEIHHRMKKDAPSGTALWIARELLATHTRKKTVRAGLPEGVAAEDELLVSSSRIGSVPGAHTVTFDSAVDTIELTHTARTRAGLAEGALTAAQWIADKKGLFTIEDMLHEI
jgi:4-hydroxy-tetrahydrodipicolinate reductase